MHSNTLTNSQCETGGSTTSHKIPHLQRLVLADTERHFARRMNIDTVDSTRVTLEQAQQSPIPCTEEGYGRVLGCGEKVRTGREDERRDGSCNSRRSDQHCCKKAFWADSPICCDSDPISFLLLKSHTLTNSSSLPDAKNLPPSGDAATVLIQDKCAGKMKIGFIE